MSILNIPLEDYLHCESYYGMCDYRYDEQKTQDLPSGVIDCDIQAAKSLLKKIQNYPDRKYIIVSSRCDYGLAYQAEHPAFKDLVRWAELMTGPEIGYQDILIKARVERDNCSIDDKYSIRSHYKTSHTFNNIPPNVIKWFNTNLHINNDNRLQCIPLGLNCTNNDKSGIKELYSFDKDIKRNKLLYVNYSLNTFERVRLRAFYSVYDFATIKNNISYNEYLEDLAAHKFCLCPSGVGLDTYRLCEALHMGCIPIVEVNECTSTLANLNMPILPMHTLMGINPNDLEVIYDSFVKNFTKFNFEPLKSSYWKRIIDSERKKLNV